MAGKGLREGEKREKTLGFLLGNICVKTLSRRLKGVCSFIIPFIWKGRKQISKSFGVFSGFFGGNFFFFLKPLSSHRRINDF